MSVNEMLVKPSIFWRYSRWDHGHNGASPVHLIIESKKVKVKVRKVALLKLLFEPSFGVGLIPQSNVIQDATILLHCRRDGGCCNCLHSCVIILYLDPVKPMHIAIDLYLLLDKGLIQIFSGLGDKSIYYHYGARQTDHYGGGKQPGIQVSSCR